MSQTIFIRKNGRVIPIKVSDKRVAEGSDRIQKSDVKGLKVGAGIGGAVGAAAMLSESKSLAADSKKAFGILRGPRLSVVGSRPSGIKMIAGRLKMAGKSFSGGSKAYMAAAAVTGGLGALFGAAIGADIGRMSGANREAERLLKERSKKRK